MVEGDHPVAFGAIGIVPDDPVGKVAAPRQHLQADLSRGTVDFDIARLNEVPNDIDNLGTPIPVGTLQYPYELTKYDGGDNDHVSAFEYCRCLNCLLLSIPSQIADKNIRIYCNFHLSLPVSIASCISCNEITR